MQPGARHPNPIHPRPLRLRRAELHVGLATRDGAAATAFYRDLMGFEELPPRSLGPLGDQRRVRIGGHEIRLYEFTEKPEVCPGGTERANGIRLLAFLLDDLDGLLARLDAAGHGYQRLRLPKGSPFQVAFSTDADGNALELVGLGRPAGDLLKTRMQIGLTVSDVARSRKFYGEALGLDEEPPMKLPEAMGVVGNERYGFRLGGTTVKFWSRRGGPLPTWTGKPSRRTGIRVIAGHVDDVDEAYANLVAREVPIKMPPHDFEGRARLMFFADPDGNWIELGTRL